MKKRRDDIVGKIGYATKDILHLSKGHYVFIRDVKGEKCSINTVTSIKDNDGNYKNNKLNKKHHCFIKRYMR